VELQATMLYGHHYQMSMVSEALLLMVRAFLFYIWRLFCISQANLVQEHLPFQLRFRSSEHLGDDDLRTSF